MGKRRMKDTHTYTKITTPSANKTFRQICEKNMEKEIKKLYKKPLDFSQPYFFKALLVGRLAISFSLDKPPKHVEPHRHDPDSMKSLNVWGKLHKQNFKKCKNGEIIFFFSFNTSFINVVLPVVCILHAMRVKCVKPIGYGRVSIQSRGG